MESRRSAHHARGGIESEMPWEWSVAVLESAKKKWFTVSTKVDVNKWRLGTNGMEPT